MLLLLSPKPAIIVINGLGFLRLRGPVPYISASISSLVEGWRQE